MLPSNILSVFLFFALFVSSSLSYEIITNTDKDISQWIFNGSYIYSKSISNLAALLPAAVVQSAKDGNRRVGIWLVKYNSPDTENYLSLKYSLKHHLFKQGIIQFMASPNVPLTVTTNNGVEVGKFWSDGKAWCDAVFSVNLHNTISIDMSTPDSEDYVLIDKITLGVMANISLGIRQLNPCLTSPMNSTLMNEDSAPDMIQKPPPNNAQRGHTDHTPPDMINKHHNRHLLRSTGQVQDRTPPDMADKPAAPRLDTSTVTYNNDNDPESNNGDPSEVKCGCSCSCSRAKGKKISNNATMTTNG